MILIYNNNNNNNKLCVSNIITNNKNRKEKHIYIYTAYILPFINGRKNRIKTKIKCIIHYNIQVKYTYYVM